MKAGEALVGMKRRGSQLRRQNMVAVGLAGERAKRQTTCYSSDVLDSPLNGMDWKHVRRKTERKGVVGWFTTIGSPADARWVSSGLRVRERERRHAINEMEVDSSVIGRIS